MSRFRISGFAAPALLIIASLAVSGQTFRGAITGSVVDASGAVIPGASVKAVSNATNLSRETATTAAGDFAFQDLQPGSYTLNVSQAGCQPVRVENVLVEVGKV